MFEDIAETLVEFLSDGAIVDEVVAMTAEQGAEEAVMSALEDPDIIAQLSDEEIETLLTELEAETGAGATASVGGQPLFGMTSSEATAVDASDFIESNDGYLYESRSDYLSGKNPYEKI